MLTIIEVITRYKIFKCFDFGFPYNRPIWFVQQEVIDIDSKTKEFPR